MIGLIPLQKNGGLGAPPGIKRRHATGRTFWPLADCLLLEPVWSTADIHPIVRLADPRGAKAASAATPKAIEPLLRWG
jgi:hypothetical protein